MNAFQKQKMAEADLVRPSAWAMERALTPASDSVISELLGENGPLARNLPGYRKRESQVGLAEAIYRGLKLRKHVIAEAGTGTGKSLAALIPAIQYCAERGGSLSNCRILVSTAMLILQDQYVNKDLPFLTEHLDTPFRWCVRKGRTNYACLRRIEKAQIGKIEVRPEDQVMFQTVEDWLPDTKTGDIAELPFDLPKHPNLKKAVTANSDQCNGAKCSLYSECFYYHSKDKTETCEIVVVNHALLVLNALCFGRILPEYDAIIIDEAHKLEDIVRGNLTEELTPRNFMRVLKVAKELKIFPESRIDEWTEEAREYLDAIDGELARIIKKPGKFRFDPATCSDAFHESLEKLQDIVRTVYVGVREVANKEEDTDADNSKVKALLAGCEKIGSGLGAFIKPSAAFVVWAERKEVPGKADRLSMHCALVKVGPWMQSNLLTRPCIFLSATLATGRGEEAFKHFKDCLGITGSPIELQVDSPFDYRANTRYSLGYYPGGLDKPPSEQLEWADLVFPRCKLVCDLTGGGCLLLFTSWRVMEHVYGRLLSVNEGQWNLLAQGEMSKADLIEAFKGEQNSVLCATSSFFEGVDVPGSALRCVVIDKIPFPIRTDPIQSAISDSYGKKAFQMHHIPHAITHLKQGVGRLVRTETDKGLIVLLDPRFRSKGYTKQILKALPGYTHPAQAPEIQAFMEGVAS